MVVEVSDVAAMPDLVRLGASDATTSDVGDDVICKKLEIPAPPAVFVFDRDGNPKQRFLRAEKPSETVYQEVGRVVDELLK